MKKLLLLLLLTMMSFYSYAQEKNVYCELKFDTNAAYTKITTRIDRGQMSVGDRQVFSKDDELTDETGESINFLSVPTVLNYMADKGWSFVQIDDAMITNAMTWKAVRLLLVKKVKAGEDAFEGIFTKGQFKKPKDAEKK